MALNHIDSKSIAAGYYGVSSETSPPNFIFSASNAHLKSKKQMNKMLNLLSQSDAVIKIRVFDPTNKIYPNPELNITLRNSSSTTPLVKEMLKLQ